MRRTIADALREEGYREGYRKGLLEGLRSLMLLELRARFKEVPIAVEDEIQAEQDERVFDEWLRAFVHASRLSDIPFKSLHPVPSRRRS
jgi:hypothetical protein